MTMTAHFRKQSHSHLGAACLISLLFFSQSALVHLRISDLQQSCAIRFKNDVYGLTMSSRSTSPAHSPARFCALAHVIGRPSLDSWGGRSNGSFESHLSESGIGRGSFLGSSL